MRNRSAALGFIFVTILIDTIGFGIIIPIVPKWIAGLIHSDISEASAYGGWLMMVYALMQFICAPVFGNLSDRYGRRPILLFSLFGFGVDYLFMAFAPNIWWLFIGRIVAGITGSSFTTAAAYVADVSKTPEERGKNFGMIGAAFGLGFIIGPAIGGPLGKIDHQYPVFAAAALSFLNWLYGYFILPESLPAEHRRKFEWKRANPVGTLLQLKKYPAITGLMVSLFFVYLAVWAVQGIWSYYNMEKFGWSEDWVGYSLAFVGLMIAVVQAGLIRVLIPKYGNEKCLYIGLIFYTIGMILFAFASQGWMMFPFIVVYCMGGIAGPALQSIISGHVPPNEQGELQGGLTSLMSVTAVIGPLLMSYLFFYFTKNASIKFPGAPFIAGAFFMLISAIIAYRVLVKEKHVIHT
jgi:DHA1 family tetracycline resistance protein-like MFS transporter